MSVIISDERVKEGWYQLKFSEFTMKTTFSQPLLVDLKQLMESVKQVLYADYGFTCKVFGFVKTNLNSCSLSGYVIHCQGGESASFSMNVCFPILSRMRFECDVYSAHGDQIEKITEHCNRISLLLLVKFGTSTEVVEFIKSLSDEDRQNVIAMANEQPIVKTFLLENMPDLYNKYRRKMLVE